MIEQRRLRGSTKAFTQNMLSRRRLPTVAGLSTTAADSDGERHAIIRRRRLPTVAGCAINDGDGDDMLWMQLVKVGNVFDRAKVPARAQPRPSHWTTMFLWESRRRRRAVAAAMMVRPLLQL